jgi:hypothetical protein
MYLSKLECFSLSVAFQSNEAGVYQSGAFLGLHSEAILGKS